MHLAKKMLRSRYSSIRNIASKLPWFFLLLLEKLHSERPMVSERFFGHPQLAQSHHLDLTPYFEILYSVSPLYLHV